jgi:energy-coupling factor transport system ATP-binding protein
MDEPTAGLDPAGREEIINHIRSLKNNHKQTIILVSHNMDDIIKLTDRVLIMSAGRIVSDDTPAATFERHNLLKSFGLSAPHISLLMSKIKNAGVPVPFGVYTVEDASNVIYNLAFSKGLVKV